MTEIQIELERRILHGLACEWELAVLELDPKAQLKPVFQAHNCLSH
jgi:hypothetical protein